jgi:hypothetical protein
MHIPQQLRDRFWQHVQKCTGTDACWLWTGRKVGQGYGGFSGGKLFGQYAHRFAYMDRIGPIPTGAQVVHVCGNRLCVRHLRLVWPSRILAARDRGRAVQRGERNPNVRLREDQVAAIRDELRQGRRQIDIARDFGISQPTVCAIGCRRRWSHIG